MLSEQIERNMQAEGVGRGSQTYPLQIVVSGGVNSVLLFRNRQATHDIDYCTANPDVINLISDANYSLMINGRLNHFPHDWINSQMIAYISLNPGCEFFYENSVSQGIILFETSVLRVYVADFKFQLVGKITRAYQNWTSAGKPDADNYSDTHLSDAVHILATIIRRTGRRVRYSEMRTWYSFGPALEIEEIHFTNNAYRNIFNVDIRPISVTT